MRVKHLLAGIFLLAFSWMWAQEVTVSGTVKDVSGEPLPGVNIVVKGTTRGTTTDFDGKYRLKVPAGSTLVFSYMGYKPKEIKVTKGGTYNVVLEPSAEALEEVVVTAMGIKKEEKSLGYAVQEVKVDHMKVAQTDPFTSLQGEVSGVLIQKTSGVPGSGVDILIRGLSSLDPNQNNQPLIVVDGIPVSNNIDASSLILPSAGTNAPSYLQQVSFANRGLDIPPEDIESITFLKGAAATALYGLMGANGVIVITTKKGVRGEPTFTFNSKITTNHITKWFEPQTMWREGYRQLAKATMDPNHPNINPVQDRGYGPGKGVWLINGATYSFHTWGPRYADDFDQTIYFHNIYDEFFRTGVMYDNNFSVRGGTEKMNYYGSVTHQYAKSVVPYTTYNKISILAKGQYKLSSKSSIQFNNNYIYTHNLYPINGDKSIMSSLAYWSTSFDLLRIWGPDGRSWNYTPYWIDNPRYYAYISSLTSDVNRYIGSLLFTHMFTDKLKFIFKGGIDTYTDAQSRIVPPDLDVGTQVNGYAFLGDYKFRQLTGNAMLEYFTPLGKDFTLTVRGGIDALAWKRNQLLTRGQTFVLPDFYHISNTTTFTVIERTLRYRLMGIFADANFEYKDRLFLNLTGRNDWTSTLIKKNRSFFYPSISLAFVFHDLIDQEENIFSFGKLRLSYAEVGKDARPGVLGQYFSTFTLPNDVLGTYKDRSEGDINAVPERQITKEIGFDLRFFDNRLRLDYTYYDIMNLNMLMYAPTPYSSGIIRLYGNVGTLHSWGHEFTGRMYWINKEKFGWNTTVNYTYHRGKAEKVKEGIAYVPFGQGNAGVIYGRVYEGDYLGSLYGYTWLYNEEGKVILDSRYRPQIDWSGVKLVGNAFPKWIASVGNHFNIGHFGFGFTLEYRKGGDIFDDFIRTATRNGNSKETEDRYTEVVWPNSVIEVAPGQYVDNDSLTMVKNEYWYRYSRYTWAAETQLRDGSWFKLRNAYVKFDIPKKYLEGTFLKKVSLNLSMSNYILWTPHKGWDPEGSSYAAGSNIYGFVGYSTPLTTNYSFGLNVTF
ncbi:MAG: SusC/RagA family TonB-linked outer membrane protein [Chlorobi bacterium]|nr:SusC/RagA family TonB-linked outer membrane protein [Chlorobiota bacterium]